jgi:hypothetical protein
MEPNGFLLPSAKPQIKYIMDAISLYRVSGSGSTFSIPCSTIYWLKVPAKLIKAKYDLCLGNLKYIHLVGMIISGYIHDCAFSLVSWFC